MRYQQNIRQNTTPNKNEERSNLRFNQPYTENVLTKVWKHFLPLLDKHFTPHNKFYKIFKRNIVKTSYSCLSNMKITVNSHNQNVTNPKTMTKDRTCNCVDKVKCPLTQNCLVSNIIYKAVSTSTNSHYKEKIYFSTGKSTFKPQYSNHQRSFQFLKHKTDTKLSSEVWQMKKSEKTPVITPKIVQRCSPDNPNSKRCYLCLNEKNGNRYLPRKLFAQRENRFDI